MGKISPVSAKYIVQAKIHIEGAVERPDVIGAIFGQTEGLLGSDLELRELQKSGRIGRIDVIIDSKKGKTDGTIVIPSSMDMTETAIVASSLETIERIGPCDAKISIEKIEDVRTLKRKYVVDRAKTLLKNLIDKGPESAELMEEIKKTVRTLEITEYGKEKLPAGPTIRESDDIIVVEGRADVINLLKNGFKNVIGLNGTSVPPSVAELSKTKTTTLFIDGDRGGNLIVKELSQVGDIDFVSKAPAGKEVEELTKKEVHKCLRAKVPLDQFKEEMGSTPQQTQNERQSKPQQDYRKKPTHKEHPKQKKERVHPEYAKQFRDMLDELTGTRGAYLLDEDMNILGKVPKKELYNTLRSLPEVDTIVVDGEVDKDAVKAAEKANISFLIGSKSSENSRKVKILSAEDLR